jgi:RNA polymerase sigma-70 factor (ECF subfamily)
MDFIKGSEFSPDALGTELMHGFAGRLIRTKVKSICRTLRLPGADEEDLEQQLRLDLLRRSPQFDRSRGTWEAFVSCVTVTRARTHFRRLQGLRRPLAESELQDGLDGCSRLSARDTHASDLVQDLERIQDQLTPDKRRLLEMLRTSSIAEIARELSVPRTTVSARVKALRGELRDLRDYVHTEPSGICAED